MVDESAGLTLHRELLSRGYDPKSVIGEIRGAEDEEVSKPS